MPTQVECTVCQKMLGQSNLSTHMKSHDGVRIEDGLGIFFRVHNKKVKETSFNCNICDKQFTWKKSLQVHIKTVHKGDQSPQRLQEKFINCEQCIEKISSYDNLYQHIKLAHVIH